MKTFKHAHCHGLTKVSELELSILGNQQILRLQVSASTWT